MVASSSAFINTTSFLCLKASSTTLAPNSTEPVTSSSTSTCAERASRNASSVTTGLQAQNGSSNCDWRDFNALSTMIMCCFLQYYISWLSNLRALPVGGSHNARPSNAHAPLQFRLNVFQQIGR